MFIKYTTQSYVHNIHSNYTYIKYTPQSKCIHLFMYNTSCNYMFMNIISYVHIIHSTQQNAIKS